MTTSVPELSTAAQHLLIILVHIPQGYRITSPVKIMSRLKTTPPPQIVEESPSSKKNGNIANRGKKVMEVIVILEKRPYLARNNKICK